jgi:hypothetical protein
LSRTILLLLLLLLRTSGCSEGLQRKLMLGLHLFQGLRGWVATRPPHPPYRPIPPPPFPLVYLVNAVIVRALV